MGKRDGSGAKNISEFREGGLFAEGYAKRNEDMAKLVASTTAEQDIAKDVKAIDRTYSKYIDKVIKERGYKGLFSSLKGLHSDQMMEMIVSTATAAGITLGVFLTIGESGKNVFALLHKDKSDQNQSVSK